MDAILKQESKRKKEVAKRAEEKKIEEERKKEEYDKMIKRKDHWVIKVEYKVSKTYEGESAP